MLTRGADQRAHRHPQQRAQHHAGQQEDAAQHGPRLRLRQMELVGENLRQWRRRRQRERHRRQITENRRQAAQQPGMEAHDDCDNRDEVNRGVEGVHR
jgi:hypothetical protein